MVSLYFRKIASLNMKEMEQKKCRKDDNLTITPVQDFLCNITEVMLQDFVKSYSSPQNYKCKSRIYNHGKKLKHCKFCPIPYLTLLHLDPWRGIEQDFFQSNTSHENWKPIVKSWHPKSKSRENLFQKKSQENQKKESKISFLFRLSLSLTIGCPVCIQRRGWTTDL